MVKTKGYPLARAFNLADDRGVYALLPDGRRFVISARCIRAGLIYDWLIYDETRAGALIEKSAHWADYRTPQLASAALFAQTGVEVERWRPFARD